MLHSSIKIELTNPHPKAWAWKVKEQVGDTNGFITHHNGEATNIHQAATYANLAALELTAIMNGNVRIARVYQETLKNLQSFDEMERQDGI